MLYIYNKKLIINQFLLSLIAQQTLTPANKYYKWKLKVWMSFSYKVTWSSGVNFISFTTLGTVEFSILLGAKGNLQVALGPVFGDDVLINGVFVFIDVLYCVVVVFLALVGCFLVESWYLSVSETLLTLPVRAVLLAEGDHRRLNTVRFQHILMACLLHHQISVLALDALSVHFLCAVAVASTSSSTCFNQFSESKPRFAVFTTGFLIRWQTESEITRCAVGILLTFTPGNRGVTLRKVFGKHVVSGDHELAFLESHIFYCFLKFLEVIQRVGNRVAGFASVVLHFVDCAVRNVVHTQTH